MTPAGGFKIFDDDDGYFTPCFAIQAMRPAFNFATALEPALFALVVGVPEEAVECDDDFEAAECCSYL